ncbi:MAG: hypothetical protein D6717_10330, partial [Gammaproteobacteria bacterium]
MKQLHFCVTLKEDVVVSARSATSGGHETLTWLPGSAFLGAVAGRLYPKLGEHAWTVFHSGQVRFANALPVDYQGRIGLPMPLCFYEPKYPGEEADKTPTNRARSDWDRPGLQPKQCREGYLLEDGGVYHPPRGFRLKTAIDRGKGYRARDGQLFGYQYLEQGSRWWLHIDADDQVADALLEQVAEALTADPVYIGRSRSAEFGRVAIEPVAAPAWPHSPHDGQLLLLYCLSDIALRDAGTGMPALQPTAAAYGLPAGRFVAGRSHLRFRSYAPFNAHRGAHDLERQVICAGSVLVFEPNAPLSQEELTTLAEKLRQGVGDYRTDGLGQIWLNPPFLAGARFVPFQFRLGLPAGQGNAKMSEAEQQLAGWLQEEYTRRRHGAKAADLARKWADDLLLVAGAPSVSQWQQLAEKASLANNLDSL